MATGETLRRHRKEREARIRDHLDAIRSRGCLVCGEPWTPPPSGERQTRSDIVLVHLRGEKRFKLVGNQWARPWATFAAEAAKAEPLCRECYRLLRRGELPLPDGMAWSTLSPSGTSGRTSSSGGGADG